MIDEWRRAGDDAPLFRFLERNPDLERADIAVDLVGLDCGAGGRHATDRDRGDAGRTPALLSADPLADPVSQRAHRGDAELLSFQVVHRLDRRVVADHHRHVARHAGHDTDRLGRHALHHERHAGPAADADVDRVGGQALLQLCVAVERRGIDLDAVLGEDAHLDADVSGVKVQANATALPTRSFSAALAGATSASARIAAAALETARRMRGMVSSLWPLTARPWSEIIAENHRSRHAARMPVACATEPQRPLLPRISLALSPVPGEGRPRQPLQSAAFML